MQNYHKDEIKAGLYILIAVVVLMGMLIMISHQGGVGPKKTYYADFSFINGIGEGSVVRFGGMKAGSVDRVFLSPDDPQLIRVQFSVLEEIPVRRLTIVAINSIGMMGDYYLELIARDEESEETESGGMVASLSSTRLDELFRSLSGIATEVRDITGQISNQIDGFIGEDSKEHFKKIAKKGEAVTDKLDMFVTNLNSITSEESQKNVKDMLNNFKDFSTSLKSKTENVLNSLESFLERLDRISKENEEEIAGTLKKMYTTMDNLENITTHSKNDVKAMVTDLRKSASHIEDVMAKNRGNISDTLHNLRISSQNAKDFTKKISLYPWTLIWRGKTEPEYRPKAER